ncbi:sensor histidine kinase [Amycolatopsis anabasis]|uniref:sensor histidine kinase n=1 Tax=Amycolatopsis anabasis TaxID=1840409 RepID=UPI00131AF90E|nr:nitrate- and nitrite sensing domain-containing protein [Amycolatopsis anabasis]
MLAIALIPSVALLAVGVALAGYLIYDAVQVRDFATKIRGAAAPAIQFFTAAQEERRLTLQELAANGRDRVALVEQRAKTDAAAAQIAATLAGLADEAPENVQRNITTVRGLLAKLPQFRQQVDAGQPALQEAYGFYNQIIDQFVEGVNGLAQGAPDAENAYLRVTAVPLFTSADGMQRGDALAAAGVAGGGLTEAEFRTYLEQIGAYHAQLEGSVTLMTPEVKARYDKLIASDAWKRLEIVENAFLRGNQTALPIPAGDWRTAAREVGDTLMSLYIQQSGHATELAIDQGERTLITSIIAGAAAILVAIGVFVVALRLSNRLIGRLARLREETLHLSDSRLPELVRRVRKGEPVDLDGEAALLDHGTDEIGQVADAFNKAQQTAIAAAVEEAKTREGTKTVFLNIAHRSQVIVHRQLKVLDQAERKQEDPDQLDTLFKLDHLSTRARRNAENLIILGGGQPGRQWRNPVNLAELVRGASAETEDFTRVGVAKLPEIAVNGPVVGDLVHLLAELIDNATSFSPPESRVEIRGNVVGRGVVIEVEDQGLGIEPERCEELNAMLADPPDFGIMALSEEPRLGLFVVARLAARHGISVTLRESAYGGTRAIVLVRSELLSPVSEPEEEPPAENPVPVQQARLPRRKPETKPEPPAPRQPAAEQQSAIDAPTRQDLFRPANQLRPQHEVRPQHEARPPAPQQPRRPEAPGRPPLPQRRRQQNLVPQLREDGPVTTPDPVREDSPEQARSRLAAFQQGTRRAREQGPNDTSGERT